MITFGYLAGWDRITIEDSNPLSFINRIADAISTWGIGIRRDKLEILADFDGIIYVTGEPLTTLPILIKELQEKDPDLPSKRTLQDWNNLLFDLYPDNSIVEEVLRAGHVRAMGINYPRERLYGGHLFISHGCIELSVSLSSINVSFELWKDLSLGLQSLLAIISNLEETDLIGDIKEWRLTLRPGMLYEEIYNGRDS